MKTIYASRAAVGPTTLPNVSHKGRDVRLSARKERRQGGQGFGKTSAPADGDKEFFSENEEPQGTRPDPPKRELESLAENAFVSDSSYRKKPDFNASSSSTELPTVGREQIISTCLQTSALIAVMGVGLDQVAPLISMATRDGNSEAMSELLHSISTLSAGLSLPSARDIGIAAGVAGAVTTTRLLLLSLWPQFKSATDTSNAQILLPLYSNPLDIGIVSVIPALAEELLFRGALLPAIYPDWRGVVISGAVFGALHINGGRNIEFGVWAGSVGCAYGAAYLYTGTLAVPMAAHALANIASASLWLSSNSNSSKDGK
ncbi:hypothetical protein Ndes2437B_g04804 [Nannochloris sp. 'desiccata']